MKHTDFLKNSFVSGISLATLGNAVIVQNKSKKDTKSFDIPPDTGSLIAYGGTMGNMPMKKYKLSFICWIMIFVIACNPKGKDIAPSSCKQIIIDQDGESFTYEFDNSGKLQSIDGKSVADYYSKNTFEISETLGNEVIELISFKNGLWQQKILDSNKDGFITYYKPEIIGGETKTTGKLIIGLEADVEVLRDDISFEYDANGNCKLEYGNISIDNELSLYHETTYKYLTDKKSPFWKNPFQFFLEMSWAEGHTNKNLAQSAYFFVSNFDDQGKIYGGGGDYKIERWGDITYSYGYDNKGRLSRIQIDKIENEKMTQLTDGTVRRNTEKSQKVVTIIYDC